MKCDFCKKEFDEKDIARLDVTPQDENGNPISETKTYNTCADCFVEKFIMGGAGK